MSDPFKVDGPTIISTSGGRTSGYMLWRVLQANGGILPKDCHAVFCNTGLEHPNTLTFVHQIEERWCPVTWLEYRPLKSCFRSSKAACLTRRLLSNFTA